MADCAKMWDPKTSSKNDIAVLEARIALPEASIFESRSPLNHGDHQNQNYGCQKNTQCSSDRGYLAKELSWRQPSRKNHALRSRPIERWHAISRYCPPYPTQNSNHKNFNTDLSHAENNSLKPNDTPSNFGASGMNWRSEDVYDLGDQNCCYTQTSWGSYTSTEQGYSRVRLFHAEISKLFERDYVWAVTQTMVSFNRKTLWLVFRVYPEYWGLVFRVWPDFWGRRAYGTNFL